MTTEELRSQLTWGYAAGIPKGVDAAWGARATLDGRTGHLDIVGDRQSTVGDPKQADRVIKALNKALPIIRKRVEKWTKDWTILGNEAKPLLLYQTKVLTVIANTKASCGYLYMVAFLTPKEA